MAIKTVSTSQPRYVLPPKGPVHLLVDAGQFQGGLARVRIGQQIVIDGRLPLRVLLGPAEALADKRVRVRALISDHSQLTNDVSVVYALTPGDPDTNTHVFREKADADGDSVEFSTTIRLITAPEEE
jgi:hypothetical protein